MRYIIIVFIFSAFIFSIGTDSTEAKEEEVSIIIEVEGSPFQAKDHIETMYPFVEIVAVYKTLFQGLALKGDARKLDKITGSDFVKGTYPVQMYEAIKYDQSILKEKTEGNLFFPFEVNSTTYTGKGVKVAIIDTGVDYHHPDLQSNFKGGFDLVDLDDEPMETLEEEGAPTYHGTHVAGIIAANGEMEGVAPDSDIYAYRALGPGGMGTSIQVIAAMEEAVEEGVDVMNLSLGNSVNGPDYPTSKAVNEAANQGVAVVVANGNDGPTNWTTGAPATASAAISVGAYQPDQMMPILIDPKTGREIKLTVLTNSSAWGLIRDFEVSKKVEDVRGKMALISLKEQDVKEEILKYKNAGAVAVLMDISNANENAFTQLVDLDDVDIPVALISEEDSKFLQEHMDGKSIFYKNKKLHKEATIAEFSSRGPVTVNWMMKPDIIAPGVNIVSTVPDGYDILNGTSMAAPHVAGAIAIMKESQPTWSNAQIYGALKTTAEKQKHVEPIAQGAGNMQLQAAIETDVIIENPLLSFGKVNNHINKRTINLSIENISDQAQQYHFTIPKKEKGIAWNLPQTFEVLPNEKVTVPITAKFNTLQLDEEIFQGELELKNDSRNFSLPYMAVNETADFPRAMGFSFSVDEQDEDYFSYELYVAEKVESVSLHLFDPDTLQDKGVLWEWTDLEIGMNEGKLRRQDVEQRGYYYGLLLVESENGDYFNYETEVYVE